MRTSIFIASLLAAIAFVSFGAAADDDGPIVSTKENRQLYAGNTAVGVAPSGRRFRVYYGKDGKVVYSDSKGLSQTGTWILTDDGMMCYDWHRWRDQIGRAHV